MSETTQIDLQARRNELAATYGKRKFSRAVVGEAMGVPGPTVMRIEQNTARTKDEERELLAATLDRLEETAAEASDEETDETGE